MHFTFCKNNNFLELPFAIKKDHNRFNNKKFFFHLLCRCHCGFAQVDDESVKHIGHAKMGGNGCALAVAVQAFLNN